jgi:hypothetical protein
MKSYQLSLPSTVCVCKAGIYKRIYYTKKKIKKRKEREKSISKTGTPHI